MKIIGFINEHKRILKGAVAITALAAVLIGLQPGSTTARAGTEKPKSETVYAVLGNDGSYTGATVVNCFMRGGEIIDYGEYTSIKNLTGPESPMVEGDKITWPASDAGDSAFYYQGETQKPLPFSVGIKYYLNGEETVPEDIAGKTGELKIEFTLKNETGTGEMDETMDREVLTPLAFSVSLALDNSMYSVLEVPENGTAVLAGSSYTLSYASFPLPEDTFSFTVFGNDMALDPINIVVLPKSPPGIDSYGDFIDVDGISQGADDMISGADDMEGGIEDLLSALYDMKDAAKLLQDGIGDINGGAKSLSNGASDLYDNVKLLKDNADSLYNGFSDFASNFALFDAGTGDLNTNVTAMAASLSDLSGNADTLDSGVGGINTGLSGVSASNSALEALAQLVADAHPGDANAGALLLGLQAQQGAIDGLAAGSTDLKTLSEGVSAGASDLNTAFTNQLVPSVQDLESSSGQLNGLCSELFERSVCHRYRMCAAFRRGGPACGRRGRPCIRYG